MKIKSKLLLILYLISYILYFIYSYAFLDIGLTLTSFKPYLNFQKSMQYFGLNYRHLSTVFFMLILILLFTIYYLLFKILKKKEISLKLMLFTTIIIVMVLTFSYPSFSHDIFNYIFNAKMVLVYHANPHIKTAMEFKDPMLDFMRNVHTPAPYFYGWTIISLLPSFFSFNRIFISLINFKIFSAFLFLLTFLVLKKLMAVLKLSNINKRLLLFLFNPLILIEAIGVGHNDMAMMLPALLSLYFLLLFKTNKKISFLLFAFCSLLFSISTKYATVILLPLFIVFLFKEFNLGLWGAVVLFLLPFTRSLDQLHSWYLIWPLTWIFLSKSMKPIYFFIILSFFALLRYAPYIWFGNWDYPVLILRTFFYFFLPIIIFSVWLLKSFLGKIE